ncbi:MAG: hypothetical protein J3Q66DRAFT_350142 [Benniella sp.]|nr:MAG: hypothetical protein J3Q66DRAFT_350142 [Benniella sp.]
MVIGAWMVWMWMFGTWMVGMWTIGTWMLMFLFDGLTLGVEGVVQVEIIPGISEHLFLVISSSAVAWLTGRCAFLFAFPSS